MRTTLTLDDDVARMLADETHRTRRPVKQVVNEALRRGLTGKRRHTPVPPYRVAPHDGGHLMPGIDTGRLNQLVDALAVDAFLEKRPPARSKAARR